jgi:hypothetical protein
MPESESYGTKLGRFWAPNCWAGWWLVLGLMPLLFFQTVVHEGTHWLTGAAGGSDPKLIPFPHLNTNTPPGRTFVGITLDGVGFIAMPQILCLILMVGLIAVFVFTSPSSRWLRTFLTWWYLGLALDLLFNTGLGLFGVFRSGTDWAKFAAGHGEGLAKLLSWVVLLAVLSQLGWIIVSRWHVNRPPGLGFFEFRWLAACCAVISLIAVIVMRAVDDRTIVENWAYWLALVGQVLSLVLYVGYIVLATVRRA